MHYHEAIISFYYFQTTQIIHYCRFRKDKSFFYCVGCDVKETFLKDCQFPGFHNEWKLHIILKWQIIMNHWFSFLVDFNWQLTMFHGFSQPQRPQMWFYLSLPWRPWRYKYWLTLSASSKVSCNWFRAVFRSNTITSTSRISDRLEQATNNIQKWTMEARGSGRNPRPIDF